MESVVGKGTSCIITLDFDYRIGENWSIFWTSIYDLGGKTILVVEDNAMNQMVIKMITKNGWIQPFCMLITVD
jgi:hypothetical protein